jgi:hypothetical protein
MTAVQQLEWVKELQSDWADNAVSVTVYYRKEELPEIQDWLEKNYENSVKSVSFLLHSEHGFALAPYEEIDQVTYDKMLSKINFSIPIVMNATGTDIDAADCSTNACPIR